MNKEQKKLVEALSTELEAGNLAVFAGAGFSRPAGFVDWKELLRPIAAEIDLDVDREIDLVALAQYHSNSNAANRNRLNQVLVNEFAREGKPTENHQILARLPISTYWTTNYDRLIEQSLKDVGKIPDTKYRVSQLPITVPKRDAVVYKMHGDVEHPDEAILTRDDYERYHLKMAPFIDALKGDLVSKTFLFLGFSFTDPNLDYILSRVRIAYERNQRQSYCIQRAVARDEGEHEADYEYRKRKQHLFEQELLRFGIKTTYVSDFVEITEILSAIETKHRRRSIFISGAAHDYAPFTEKDGVRFVFDLAKSISKQEYRVLSGFGLGIGSAVISGVVEATAMGGRALDEDRLLVRPFPQSRAGDVPLSELWRIYRQDTLKRSGIAIFVFGNKRVDDDVLSDGMRAEYDIARENKVFVIPVGITGGMARELWAETINLIDSGEIFVSAEARELLIALGEPSSSLEDARENILKLIKLT
ncbi:SIR2 family protein [Xanthomonas sontii]|uniref:SIR2 family protein n=1 Tax=Xanthomonas sontii TaxID=2650745 RepID=UPI0011E4078A|nr:SIR2 family protein [Xanthomonas sontii]MDQ7760546.1 SIR2 family protein [Xanthomonas sontii]TYD36011.1 hypothetical protein CEK63_06495 [Xanthomonas sontii]UZK05330.1 hypothetical protein CJ027_000235 [Xanthomonas sontii]